MSPESYMRPLEKRKRRYFFWLLGALFISVLPFLYLYATGYRFSWTERMNFISTGGLYIAAEQTGVEIYIDNQLARETRIFGKAFYAQNIDPATHRVHVQKVGYHTWVKELPVYAHLVTEVQAFNLPLVPHIRPITRLKTATGTPIVIPNDIGNTIMGHASSSVDVYATTTTATTTFTKNQEYADIQNTFGIAEQVTPKKKTVAQQVESALESATGVATTAKATTTKEYNNVRLFQDGDDVYAEWVGSREGMPYFYCAKAFDPLPKDAEGKPVYVSESTTSPLIPLAKKLPEIKNVQQKAAVLPDELMNPPVQKVPEGEACVPRIQIDRKWQKVKFFDFFPGNSNLVVMVLEHGVYAVETDNRSWQNVQPILEGDNLDARISNGHIVVYDGSLFYEMLYE